MIENAILALTDDEQTTRLRAATTALLRQYTDVARTHVFSRAKADGADDAYAEERSLASGLATLVQGLVREAKKAGVRDPIGDVGVGLGMVFGSLEPGSQIMAALALNSGVSDGMEMVAATRPPPGTATN